LLGPLNSGTALDLAQITLFHFVAGLFTVAGGMILVVYGLVLVAEPHTVASLSGVSYC
jgi:hypothetical protein